MFIKFSIRMDMFFRFSANGSLMFMYARPDAACAAYASCSKNEAVSKLPPRLCRNPPARAQCCSIFSINIPYPFLLSWTNTWVIAPMNLPFCTMGLPLRDMSILV